jgi:hypothetical protein
MEGDTMKREQILWKHDTDSAFRQKFWRDAFVYAHMMEQIGNEDAQKYRQLRDYLLELTEYRMKFNTSLLNHSIRMERERMEMYICIIFFWPLLLFIISIFIDFTIIAVILGELNKPVFYIVYKIVPLMQEFCTWFQQESSTLRFLLFIHYIQARIWVLVMT